MALVPIRRITLAHTAAVAVEILCTAVVAYVLSADTSSENTGNPFLRPSVLLVLFGGAAIVGATVLVSLRQLNRAKREEQFVVRSLAQLSQDLPSCINMDSDPSLEPIAGAGLLNHAMDASTSPPWNRSTVLDRRVPLYVRLAFGRSLRLEHRAAGVVVATRTLLGLRFATDVSFVASERVPVSENLHSRVSHRLISFDGGSRDCCHFDRVELHRAADGTAVTAVVRFADGEYPCVTLHPDAESAKAQLRFEFDLSF